MARSHAQAWQPRGNLFDDQSTSIPAGQTKPRINPKVIP